MKKRTLIRNLAFFLLPTAFLAGAVQASPVVEERGFQDKLSKISTFQTAVLSISNDIGSDGLKRRGDGSIDDNQPGQASHNDDIGSDGLKRRGDGSIDDSQPGQASHNDDIGSDGLKRRGDGSISTRTSLSQRRYWIGWTETSRGWFYRRQSTRTSLSQRRYRIGWLETSRGWLH
jgi:hypothetical protein